MQKGHPSGWLFAFLCSTPPDGGPDQICRSGKTKGPVFRLSLLFYLMSGSSLLSHGETPHYHRRYGVSLLSSAWGQVGPPRYSRQANSFVLSTQYFIASAALAAFVNVSHILMYAPSVTSFAALPLRKLLRTTIRYQAENSLYSAKTSSAL